jgi:hypothetical protein
MTSAPLSHGYLVLFQLHLQQLSGKLVPLQVLHCLALLPAQRRLPYKFEEGLIQSRISGENEK